MKLASILRRLIPTILIILVLGACDGSLAGAGAPSEETSQSLSLVYSLPAEGDPFYDVVIPFLHSEEFRSQYKRVLPVGVYRRDVPRGGSSPYRPRPDPPGDHLASAGAGHCRRRGSDRIERPEGGAGGVSLRPEGPLIRPDVDGPFRTSSSRSDGRVAS